MKKSSKKDYKPKKCRQCGKEFKPFQSLQKVCSVECAVKDSRETTEKNRKKRVSEMRKGLRDSDRSFWLKKTQTIFNKFIRLRDEKDNCISCGKNLDHLSANAIHAGHFRSVGATRDALRFNEMNCHKQCGYCNTYLSGNIKGYRPNLIEKIGLDNVEWLEKDHKPVKLTIDDLKKIHEEYKLKVKELESDKGEGSRG